MATSTSPSSSPVLAAVDLQFHSDEVIAQAYTLALSRQCPLLVLHVLHDDAATPGVYQRHKGQHPAAPLIEIARTLLRERIADTLGDTSEPPVIPVYRRVVEGIPAHRIHEVAEQVDARALVLFSHARNGLARLWHGSVTDGVRKRCHRELIVLTEPLAAPPPPLVENTFPGRAAVR